MVDGSLHALLVAGIANAVAVSPDPASPLQLESGNAHLDGHLGIALGREILLGYLFASQRGEGSSCLGRGEQGVQDGFVMRACGRRGRGGHGVFNVVQGFPDCIVKGLGFEIEGSLLQRFGGGRVCNNIGRQYYETNGEGRHGQ